MDSKLLQLHRDLVSIPSVSHEETQIADFVEATLRSSGATIWRHGNNVAAWLSDSPRLLLNSHLDTVPPSSDWTHSPWNPTVQGGKVFGLGSNDAKASVAAMMCTFVELAARGVSDVSILLSPEEETGGEGTEQAWPILRDEMGWKPEGIIVGEPTELQIGTSQKGLLVLEIIACGAACHAANADAMGIENPVFQLADDLLKMRNLKLKSHSQLGPCSVHPTVLKGSDARNQIASTATALIDIRSVPVQTHDELIELVRTVCKSEVSVVSKRLQPYECPGDSRIVQATLQALPNSKTFASRTMSDQAHFVGHNAIKLGPGISARSHTADEFVLEAELIAGRDAYLAIATEFLAG